MIIISYLQAGRNIIASTKDFFYLFIFRVKIYVLVQKRIDQQVYTTGNCAKTTKEKLEERGREEKGE